MDTTQETVTDVKTFRGRTLEEVLPQIRAELGADAIVVRRREGLAGGVAGFFQRSYVEVEARSALPEVRKVIPGLNGPTIIDILNGGVHVAVHAVVSADSVYRAVASLKSLGAEGILVTRIERLMP